MLPSCSPSSPSYLVPELPVFLPCVVNGFASVFAPPPHWPNILVFIHQTCWRDASQTHCCTHGGFICTVTNGWFAWYVNNTGLGWTEVQTESILFSKDHFSRLECSSRVMRAQWVISGRLHFTLLYSRIYCRRNSFGICQKFFIIHVFKTVSSSALYAFSRL